MKVLIADDEIIIREGMANVIPWEENGFLLLDPAASAEEVIERIETEKPDILITDIQMKEMNGLELVSYIGKKNYCIESILLTGYDDFAYIQEALRQDVCDYLLKTSSPDEIITAVNRAKKRLEKDKKYHRWSNAAYSEEKNTIVQTLFHQRDSKDQAKLAEALPELATPPYQLILIGTTLDTQTLHSYEKIWNGYLYGTWLHDDRFTLILTKRNTYLEDGYLLQMAIKKIRQMVQQPIFMSNVISTLNELPYKYEQLSQLHLYKYIFTDAVTISEQMVKERTGIAYHERKEEFLQQLITFLHNGEYDNLITWVHAFHTWLFSHSQATPDSIQFYVQNLYMETIRYMNRIQDHERRYESIPSASSWFQRPTEILQARFSQLQQDFQKQAQKNSNYVEQSIYYIEEHLGQSLSLQEVAGYISIHPNYLSELIRKKTGKSYVELVTTLRVQKAVDFLLYTSLTVKEIAKNIGYNDRKYFTKIFKKHYGVTPTQYRRRN
ncbi:response regulator transcription factor [Virgibacillus salexigens]|uniref:DNA-binding response regulator n=1 Tax=Virgibacillus kapii TaxID=1638645 RepID=A0ABQ2DK05_9BACI|nr:MULTISPECIES: response regulator [Virgibacillus]GGJ60729.1 DNA-binding response regulator [Virgibacillus kapii]